MKSTSNHPFNNVIETAYQQPLSLTLILIGALLIGALAVMPVSVANEKPIEPEAQATQQAST
ncbi:MAG: hypothetical protein ACI9FJ_003150, partial [Alteromonadaceae bacterium]